MALLGISPPFLHSCLWMKGGGRKEVILDSLRGQMLIIWLFLNKILLREDSTSGTLKQGSLCLTLWELHLVKQV